MPTIVHPFLPFCAMQVVAERAIGPDDAALAELGPGSQLEVGWEVTQALLALIQFKCLA